MSSSTFGWAWDLELPAEPKMLLLVLMNACGMYREYDVDHLVVGRKAGIPPDEMAAALHNLAARDLVDILEPAETPEGVTTIYLRYPLQDWDAPLRSGKKDAPRVNNLPGWLYVIAGGDGITKIGVSNNVAVRLRALEKASGRELKLVWTFPATISAVRGFEQHLHRQFDSARIRGEWFKVDPEQVIAAAIQICGGPGTRPGQGAA